MRLDKFVSQTTGLSRKEVKKCLKAGEITIDQKIVTDPSEHIDVNAKIYLQQTRLNQPKKQYLMLNKPIGYVCATTDSEHPTVLDLIKISGKKSLQIVGRLDIDTTGLVLLTDDGQWNHRVSSPRSHSSKYYSVTLADPIDKALITEFHNGVWLRGEKTKTLPADLSIQDTLHATIAIQEGRYHQIKRMFASAGNKVTQLHRFQIGSLSLDKDLKPGEYRPLTDEEINHVFL